jgi:hypothetical protein
VRFPVADRRCCATAAPQQRCCARAALHCERSTSIHRHSRCAALIGVGTRLAMLSSRNRRRAMTTLTDTLPTTSETTATTTATTAEAVTSIDQLEAYIARHLLGWGVPATFLGMAVGYHFGSFAGAVPSAAIGTVVGVLTGTAVAAYKRRQR